MGKNLPPNRPKLWILIVLHEYGKCLNQHKDQLYIDCKIFEIQVRLCTRSGICSIYLKSKVSNDSAENTLTVRRSRMVD